VIVTHLAPVAAFAQHHFLVNKQVAGRATDGGPAANAGGKAASRKASTAHVAEAAGAAGDERTRSTVRLLAADEVEKELAAMAMGDSADAAALQQTRSLVQKARAAGGGAGRSAKAS